LIYVGVFGWKKNLDKNASKKTAASKKKPASTRTINTIYNLP